MYTAKIYNGCSPHFGFIAALLFKNLGYPETIFPLRLISYRVQEIFYIVFVFGGFILFGHEVLNLFISSAVIHFNVAILQINYYNDYIIRINLQLFSKLIYLLLLIFHHSVVATLYKRNHFTTNIKPPCG